MSTVTASMGPIARRRLSAFARWLAWAIAGVLVYVVLILA